MSWICVIAGAQSVEISFSVLPRRSHPPLLCAKRISCEMALEDEQIEAWMIESCAFPYPPAQRTSTRVLGDSAGGASSCLCVLTGAVSWAGLALCADLFPLCDMSRN